MLLGITFKGKIQLIAFCIFEACVGIFWPSMMKLRSQYVPEESRSTIINLFRIPLNLFVCIMLYNVSSHSKLACLLTARNMLYICVGMIVYLLFGTSANPCMQPA